MLGVLSDASKGVEIVRGGTRLPAEGSAALQLGDRVIVPEGGSANVAFPASASNPNPLVGVFSGGSEAVIGVKTIAPGVDQVVVDLAAGDFIVAPPDFTQIESSLLVRKKAAVADGGLGWLLPLGLLGLAGLAGSGGGGGDNTDTGTGTGTGVGTDTGTGTGIGTDTGTGIGTDTGTGTGTGTDTGTGTGTDTGTGAEGMGFLDPTATLVDNLTDALEGPSGAAEAPADGAAKAELGGLASGLGTSLQPVDDLVASVTDAGNGLLAPVVGEEFFADDPNSLDSVDALAADVTGGVVSVPVTPLVDSILGNGVTATLISPADLQVDFVTDGLTNALGSSGLLGVGETAGVGGLLGPLTGMFGSLGGAGSVLAPVGALGNTATGENTPGVVVGSGSEFVENVSGNGSTPGAIPPISSSTDAASNPSPLAPILSML
ncbi:MAG: hypothetical protein V4562_02585 [Pseudomonadota bacterium]